MTGFEILMLIGSIIVLGGIVGWYLVEKQPTIDMFLEEEPKKEKFQPRKVTIVKEEKNLQLTESAKELIKEMDKVTGKETSQEQTLDLAKQMVEAAVTTPKKKRKYYPKKNKA